MAPIKYLILGAGLLASVIADSVSFSEWPANLTPGQPVTLKWVGGSDAPATITLRKGVSTDLQDVQVLTDDAVNGEFSWTPPANLQNSDQYAFEISQGDQINYTGLIPLSGGVDAPTPDDKTQADAVNQSTTASVTDAPAASTSSSSESASASTTEAPASTSSTSSASTSSTAGATMTDATTSSQTGSSATSSSVSTETATPSRMNTPFVGSTKPSSTASSSSSVQNQTDSAGRTVGAPLAAIVASVAFLLLVQ